MFEHPNALRLEGLHAGESDAEAAAHVSDCAQCADYLSSLEESQREFLSRCDAQDFVDRVRLRAGRRRSGRWWRVAVPIAVAAAACLIALVLLPGDVGPETEANRSLVRTKGGATVVVIRKRGELQTRHGTAFSIATGDRLRVEITLPRSQLLAVGILQDDGAWFSFGDNIPLRAGVHLLERTLEVDENPRPGHVLAGNPSDVKRAVMSRAFAAVAAMPISVGLTP